MKKHILSLIFGFIIFNMNAQNVWNSSTVSTYTSGDASIGTSTPDARLHIYSKLENDGESNGLIGKTAFKIDNLQFDGVSSSFSFPNIAEIWNSHFFGTTPDPDETDVPVFIIDRHGNIGIGTSSPAYKLDVIGNFACSSSASVGGDIGVAGSGAIAGKLRIGSTAPASTWVNYALSVDGDIIAKRVVVEASDWADFVFAPSFKLASLYSVEQFILENHHLPGVPSLQDVTSNGIDVAAMNKILLQKVEELTLYMIQMQKEIDELQTDDCK